MAANDSSGWVIAAFASNVRPGGFGRVGGKRTVTVFAITRIWSMLCIGRHSTMGRRR
jgi:hypothetical protein